MDLQELIKDAGSFQLNRDYFMRLKEGKKRGLEKSLN